MTQTHSQAQSTTPSEGSGTCRQQIDSRTLQLATARLHLTNKIADTRG